MLPHICPLLVNSLFRSWFYCDREMWQAALLGDVAEGYLSKDVCERLLVSEWVVIAKDTGISKAAWVHKWFTSHTGLEEKYGDGLMPGAT